MGHSGTTRWCRMWAVLVCGSISLTLRQAVDLTSTGATSAVARRAPHEPLETSHSSGGTQPVFRPGRAGCVDPPGRLAAVPTTMGAHMGEAPSHFAPFAIHGWANVANCELEDARRGGRRRGGGHGREKGRQCGGEGARSEGMGLGVGCGGEANTGRGRD